MRRLLYILFVVTIALQACNGNKSLKQHDAVQEKMLQGLWFDPDDESLVFRVENDTLYYSEENVLPTYFRIADDTLYLEGVMEVKYAILKLTENSVQLENNNGEKIQLIKGNSDMILEEKHDVQVNQELLKRDTVVYVGEKKYHCYTQVNPTTYQVVKQDYTDDGLSVGKVYYDNIVNLTVYDGGNRLFSSDFRKQNFERFVPTEVMRQSVLSDIVYKECKEGAIVLQAQLCIPESAVEYLVNIIISDNGDMHLSQ